MSRILPGRIAGVAMIDGVMSCMGWSFMVVACLTDAVCMRRDGIKAGVAMRGAEMGNPALGHKHHRDGEDKYLHHPAGRGDEPSDARHAMMLVILNTPRKVCGAVYRVNRLTVTILRWLQKSLGGS